MCVPEMHNGALTNDMIEQFGMVGRCWWRSEG